MNDDQDWTVVTIGRKKKPQNLVNTQMKVSPQVAHAAKVAKEEYTKPKHLTSESRQEMLKKRVEMGLSQVQLNQRCAFPVNTVREIEAGRLPPSINELNTLNRVLKLGLKLEH
jgi:ribosome-binding protein aMBF1 (putative translation factor)